MATTDRPRWRVSPAHTGDWRSNVDAWRVIRVTLVPGALRIEEWPLGHPDGKGAIWTDHDLAVQAAAQANAITAVERPA